MIGEIVLIVIGILIALQVNSWNENRKAQKAFKSYIEQLKADVETAIKNAEGATKFSQLQSDRSQNIIDNRLKGIADSYTKLKQKD